MSTQRETYMLGQNLMHIVSYRFLYALQEILLLNLMFGGDLWS